MNRTKAVERSLQNVYSHLTLKFTALMCFVIALHFCASETLEFTISYVTISFACILLV